MSGRTICYCADESEALLFDGETFAETETRRAKKYFCGAVVPSDDIHSHTFKVPAGTDESKLDTLVEITMFEAGGLDLEKEYAIAYVRHVLEFDASWLIEAFAVEQAKLKERFGAIAARTGHIDLLAVPYTVYEALYVFDKADAGAIELFLYLSDETSYAVLCKEGRYIAHRNLPSLSSIAAKANVSTEVVRETLRKRGLESERYGPDERLLIETLQEAFSKIVERVAQTVNHKRGIFGITKVDRLLLDFEQSLIPGLWELFDGYGFEESQKGALSCCERLEPAMQHRGLEALYMVAVNEGKTDAPNLTIFEKRPGFLQTHTGRFVALLAAGALLIAGYALLKESELGNLEERYAQLNGRLNVVKQKAAALRKAAAKERAGLDEVMRRLEESRGEIMAFDETADAALLIEESKIRRRKMVRDVDRALARYSLAAASMEQNGSKRMAIEILSDYGRRDRIAKFMKALIEMGYRSVEGEEVRLGETLSSHRV
ncbi:hypothetical protein, partial [Hydrogenimonas sp.]